MPVDHRLLMFDVSRAVREDGGLQLLLQYSWTVNRKYSHCNRCQGLTLEKAVLGLCMDSSHTDNYIRECDVDKTFERYSQEREKKMQQ